MNLSRRSPVSPPSDRELENIHEEHGVSWQTIGEMLAFGDCGDLGHDGSSTELHPGRSRSG